MRALLSVLTVLLAWSAAPSGAQTWSPAQVLSYCSPEEAFGRRFGETAPAPRAAGAAQVDDFTNDFPPFIFRGTRFEQSADRPVIAVLADSQFPSPREARAAFNRLRDALRASGRFATMVEPARGVARFHTYDAATAQGLVVTLKFEGRLIMQCADAARFPEILHYGDR